MVNTSEHKAPGILPKALKFVPLLQKNTLPSVKGLQYPLNADSVAGFLRVYAAARRIGKTKTFAQIPNGTNAHLPKGFGPFYAHGQQSVRMENPAQRCAAGMK